MENEVAMRSDHVQRIASISKKITDAAILLLVS